MQRLAHGELAIRWRMMVVRVRAEDAGVSFAGVDGVDGRGVLVRRRCRRGRSASRLMIAIRSSRERDACLQLCGAYPPGARAQQQPRRYRVLPVFGAGGALRFARLYRMGSRVVLSRSLQSDGLRAPARTRWWCMGYTRTTSSDAVGMRILHGAARCIVSVPRAKGARCLSSSPFSLPLVILSPLSPLLLPLLTYSPSKLHLGMPSVAARGVEALELCDGVCPPPSLLCFLSELWGEGGGLAR
jgi:hypothetical protein